MGTYMEVHVLPLGVQDTSREYSHTYLRALATTMRIKPHRTFTYHSDRPLAEGSLVEMPYGSEVRFGVVKGSTETESVQELSQQVTIRDVIAARPDLLKQVHEQVGDLHD